MTTIPGFVNHDASQDLFSSFEFGTDSMWSIQPDISSMTVGDAKYTILASNISADEADMIPYRSTTLDEPISNALDSESFRFRYFAVKYTAGTATGSLTIHWQQKLDK